MGMYDPVATNHIDLDLYWVVKLVQIVVAVQVEPQQRGLRRPSYKGSC